jgi:hypothetical protein
MGSTGASPVATGASPDAPPLCASSVLRGKKSLPMSKSYRTNAVLAQTPAADYKSSKGYLVTLADGTATINASTSVLSKGVIVEGNDTTAGYSKEKVSIALLCAYSGTVPMRLGGAVTAGAFVQQYSDGTVISDAGSGARVIVGIACESGVAGENIEVAPMAAITLS